MKYQNYIFDFGQVLVRFDPEYMTHAEIAEPAQVKALKDIVFDRLYWDPLDAGAMTDEQAKAAICSRLPAESHADACRVYDRWLFHLPPIKGMEELLRQIKADGGKLFLLSNISIGFAQNWAQVPQLRALFSLFEGLVFSGPLGITKPNKAIFDHLLNTYGLRAEDSCFIDDSQKNVAGAEAAGIAGILFSGDAEALKKRLL